MKRISSTEKDYGLRSVIEPWRNMLNRIYRASVVHTRVSFSRDGHQAFLDLVVGDAGASIGFHVVPDIRK